MLKNRERGISILKRVSISNSIEEQLNDLASALERKGKLALYDLHKYCEDFSAHLLNLVYGYNLKNLNLKKFNEPGIDLGDEDNMVAFQVTTNKKSKKVNDTLEKLTDEQKEKYEDFNVFIVGDKQKNYTINEELAAQVGFTKDNILDITDILSRINTLPITRMQEIDDFLKSELYKAHWAFNGGKVQSILLGSPTLIFPNCKALVEHYVTTLHPLNITDEEEWEMEEGIRNLMNAIISLPPASIQFFYSLIVKVKYSSHFDGYSINIDKMERFVNLTKSAYITELKILQDENLIKFDEDFEGNTFIILSGLCDRNCALNHILEFVKAKEIDLEDIFLKFDLSTFAVE